MTTAYPWPPQGRYVPVAPQHAHYLRTAGKPLAGWSYAAAVLLLGACLSAGLAASPHAPLAYLTMGLGFGAGAYTATIGTLAQQFPKVVASGYFDLQLANRMRRGAIVNWYCALTMTLLAISNFVVGLTITTEPYTPPVFAYLALFVVPPVALGYALYAMITVRRLLTYPGPRP